MLDVIIPILNEEKILEERRSYFLGLKNKARLIFVDGGSADRSREIAREYGEIVISERGRGVQKNAGAKLADSAVMLFLHVDGKIPVESLDHLEKALMNGNSCGCYTLSVEDRNFIFRIFEWLVNLRARAFGIMDGDLGFGVRRDVFDQVGGFDPVPIMEDILISEKIRRFGKAVVLKDPIQVSSRRWHKAGFFKTFVMYSKAYLLRAGKPPHLREVGR